MRELVGSAGAATVVPAYSGNLPNKMFRSTFGCSDSHVGEFQRQIGLAMSHVLTCD